MGLPNKTSDDRPFFLVRCADFSEEYPYHGREVMVKDIADGQFEGAEQVLSCEPGGHCFDISKTTAAEAWELLRPDWDGSIELPAFIQRHIPDLDDQLAEMLDGREQESRHVAEMSSPEATGRV